MTSSYEYKMINNSVSVTPSCLHNHGTGAGAPPRQVDHYGACSPSEDENTPLTWDKLHLLAHDIHEYDLLKERVNFFRIYIVMILLYIGLNGALLYANSKDQSFIEANYEYPFHIVSFWGVFIFTIIEATILMATDVVKWSNKWQSTIVLTDVSFSFFAALLYTLDPETFEVPAHYVEYSVQIMISFVDVIFVSSYSSSGAGGTKIDITGVMGVWSYLVVGLSLLQLFLYSELIPTKMGGERSGHFCEFTNEILNGVFALVYAIVTYNDWQQVLDQHVI